MKKINVLIFPAGEINSVELHDALSTCVNINVYGASSIERHGRFIFNNYIKGLPNITEDNFISEFNKMIDANNIDMIFPTHDTISLFLNQNSAAIKAKIAGGDFRTTEICRYKHQTYNLFKNNDFVPVIYEDIRSIKKYPVFIKPNVGQGTVNAKMVTLADELVTIDFGEYVVSEYLPGEELTVDCFTDKDGRLRYVSPRTRDRIMAGVSVAGRTIQATNEIQHIAGEINSQLHFLGLWYFQVKQDCNNRYKLLEISTRCAGAMCLTRAKGVNLPLLSVYALMGYETEVFDNDCNVIMDRTLIGRYDIDYEYDAVYLDLDDTLIVNGKVNLNAIRFLYQCRNKHINVFLLSKHAKYIDATLEEFAISKSLFSAIFHLKQEDDKYKFINHPKSIFIDNAFMERKMVKEKLNIPVFDVDGIEFLLDWRI